MMGINPSMRRAWLARNTGHGLAASAHTAFAAEDVRTNIENLVGAVEVPLGIAGPLRVNGSHASGSFYVPFATTEGTRRAPRTAASSMCSRTCSGGRFSRNACPAPETPWG